jgi:hypothetical protein
MRSRERLITVLKSVNKNVYPEAEPVAWGAAIHLEGNFSTNCGCDCIMDLQFIKTAHASPHLRELAAEALHYIRNP